MKLLVNRAALVEALGLASSVVLSRTPKPVLTCVKLVAGNTGNTKTLTLVATDMELALQYTMTQVDIATPGIALIPAGKLSEIVNNSPDDTLTLETNADTTAIKGSDANYKVFGYNAEEFPPVSAFEGSPDFSLTAGSLRTLLDRTRFAAAREMTRFAINGVLFEKKGKKLSLVATDGHRLAQTKDDTIGGGGEPGRDVSAVVPIKAINLIERLLTDPEQTVSLQFKENKLYVQVSSETGGVAATMSTSLVEGTFPPYNDVIPKDSDKKVTLNRDRFFSAVRRAALLTNEESKGVRLAFASGTLSISSRAPEMGEAKIDLPVEYAGEAIEIGFNPNYLMDALKVADQETVTFEMKTPNKPGLLKSGPGFLYVVMPVNLS